MISKVDHMYLLDKRSSLAGTVTMTPCGTADKSVLHMVAPSRRDNLVTPLVCE